MMVAEIQSLNNNPKFEHAHKCRVVVFFPYRKQIFWPSQPRLTGLGTPIEYFGKDKVISLGNSFLLLLALKTISIH